MLRQIKQTIVLFLCSEISIFKPFAIAFSTVSDAWHSVDCISSCNSSAIVLQNSSNVRQNTKSQVRFQLTIKHIFPYEFHTFDVFNRLGGTSNLLPARRVRRNNV